MMFTNGYSKAFFGDRLWGDQLLRFIFMDEAGTSQHEPVTVVVGLIANADNHVLSAEALALEAIGAVPSQFKEGFVFHAKQIMGDKKFQNDWSITDRLRLLEAMMSIPRKIGMAVTIAAQWRNAVDFSSTATELSLSTWQYEHIYAFAQCIAMADRNIRRHAGPREIGTVVAEDVPEIRRYLSASASVFRDKPFFCPPSLLRVVPSDVEAGYNTQSGEMRVTRVRRAVHFVGKADEPLVQVADACAYGLNRFFSQRQFGTEYARAILGDEKILRNFATPGGAECHWFVNPDFSRD
jgi:hypothetical protein